MKSEYYLYQIGCIAYEKTAYTELRHKNQYTENDINEFIEESILALLTDKGRYAFGDIYNDIISWLEDNKEFIRVEYQARLNRSGYAIYSNPNGEGVSYDC